MLFMSFDELSKCVLSSRNRATWFLLAGAMSASVFSTESYSDVIDPEVIAAASSGVSAPAVAADMFSWSVVPGVIFDDGAESFVVNVELPEAADSVFMKYVSSYLIPSGDVTLNDAGQGQDELAGDNIWTSGLIQFDSSMQREWKFTTDPDSPRGLEFIEVGQIVVVRNGVESEYFGNRPQLGLLDHNEPLITSRLVSATAQASPHFVNLNSDIASDVQESLRQASSANYLRGISQEFYQVFGDDYDFLTFLSPNRQLFVEYSTFGNFTAGMNLGVRNDVFGLGKSVYDISQDYGSAQQLQSVLILDNAGRGLKSSNFMHEITHRFAAFLDAPETGFKRNASHWSGWGSVESLLGGKDWIDNLDGSFTIGCNLGNGGVYQMPALERYLFGLQTSENIPTIRFPKEGVATACGEVMEPGEYHEFSANDILAGMETRFPGPAESQKEFRIAFIGATSGRLMTAVEMTFYEKLASWVTKTIPVGDSDPLLSISNWVPIGRYAPEITWRTDISIPAYPCVEYVATNADHVSSNRAFSEVEGQTCFGTFCFGGTTTYYAVGSNDNLGSGATTSQALKETDTNFYELGSCPAGPDTVAPVIARLGASPMTVSLNGQFIDPGVTASDDRDGDITANVITSGFVDTTTLGSYVLTYDVSDAAGNAAITIDRTVNVVEGSTCFETTLANHVTASRAYEQYSLYYATGTATYLGSTYTDANTVVALEEATQGNWSVVNSCN